MVIIFNNLFYILIKKKIKQIKYIWFFSALSLRGVVRAAGVRADSHVYVDVHRGPLPAQRGHTDRVPGAVSSQALHHTGMGGTLLFDHHLVVDHGVF